jgi:DNA-binding transcriptional ArsR family regulator
LRERAQKPHTARITVSSRLLFTVFSREDNRVTQRLWADWCFIPISKSRLDSEKEIHYHMVVDKLGTTFAALSDPTRRAMIERLSHGPASVHGLTEPFALSQQMISKHIAYLVRARMVIKTKRGRESVCTLRPAAIKTVSDWAISYRRFWEESFDKLDVVVNQMKKEEVRDDRKHG